MGLSYVLLGGRIGGNSSLACGSNEGCGVMLGESVRLNLSRPIKGPFSGSLLGSKDSFIMRRWACTSCTHTLLVISEHKDAVSEHDRQVNVSMPAEDH